MSHKDLFILTRTLSSIIFYIGHDYPYSNAKNILHRLSNFLFKMFAFAKITRLCFHLEQI